MTDEELRLTREEIAFLKEQVADQKALKRTWGRMKKYLVFLGTLVGAYALLGEQLPEIIKKWLN